MLKQIIQLLIVGVLISNFGCIHTAHTETQSVSLSASEKKPQTTNNSGPLVIETIIYRPNQLPLENFFRGMQKGEFVEAFKKINFSYQQSNADNQMIKEMLNDGLVPAFVRFKNISAHPLPITPTHFALNFSEGESRALATEDIPHQFERFNPAAFAANIYNVTVVVATSLAICIAFSTSSNRSWPFDVFHSQRHSDRTYASHYGNNDILNPLNKTTKIDYQGYLIGQETLAPGKETQGLLFFRVKPEFQNNQSLIEFKPIQAGQN